MQENAIDSPFEEEKWFLRQSLTCNLNARTQEQYEKNMTLYFLGMNCL